MRIVILQGHPDPAGGHFCHALADAYAEGAASAGHEVRRVETASLDFPILRTKEDFETSATPPALLDAQEAILWANHLVLVYPLWLGTMPASFKAFLEQLLRPGFAFGGEDKAKPWRTRLKGRSVRVVVTMGMPAFFYRTWFGAHSLKSLERNILGFCGFRPIRDSVIGGVESGDGGQRRKWLARMAALGRKGR